MKLVVPELNHADLEKDGFEKHDIFERKEFGEKLKNLVKNSGGAITIGLDSGWGNGKTTFIKMWQGHIKNDMQSIYFDAFANDYQKEPFLALTTEIYGLIPKKDKELFKEIVQNVLKPIIRRGLRSGISILSGGIIDGNIVDSIEKTFKTLTNQSFENVTEDKKAMTDFKEFLANWTKEQEKPVVFIIDELDRCRPDFALELIEQIKHLFWVEGITFLLVTNKNQLEQSIKHRYGDINASEYLQKFVHLWLQFPRKGSKYDGDDGSTYALDTIKKMFDGDIARKNQTENQTENILLEIINILKPSLREVDQILTLVAILINASKSVDDFEDLSRIFVCCLKVCNPSLLERIIDKNINVNEVSEDIKIDDSTDLYKIIRFDLADDSERKKMIEGKDCDYSKINCYYDSHNGRGIIKKFYDDIVSLSQS